MTKTGSKASERIKNYFRRGFADVSFDFVNIIFLVFSFVVVFFPLWYILVSSFSDPAAVASGQVTVYPVKPTAEAYTVILAYKKIWRGFFNSVIYCAMSAVITLLCVTLAAYPLSRKELVFKKFFTWFFFFTTFFGGGLIPTYLVVDALNLIDTPFALILPGAAPAFYIIMMRTFFQGNVPGELLEAGTLDGCGDVRLLTKIVFPLSKAIYAVIGLYCVVAMWNGYFSALIYLNDEKLFPFQIILREILIQNNQTQDMLQTIDDYVKKAQLNALLKYSIIVVSTLPLAVLYPFLQKYFVKGVLIGSVKG